jgi:hypothetical protein
LFKNPVKKLITTTDEVLKKYRDDNIAAKELMDTFTSNVSSAQKQLKNIIKSSTSSRFHKPHEIIMQATHTAFEQLHQKYPNLTLHKTPPPPTHPNPSKPHPPPLPKPLAGSSIPLISAFPLSPTPISPQSMRSHSLQSRHNHLLSVNRQKDNRYIQWIDRNNRKKRWGQGMEKWVIVVVYFRVFELIREVICSKDGVVILGNREAIIEEGSTVDGIDRDR